MHELAVTKSILKLALDYLEKNGGNEILSIHLVIGEMRNLEEDWIQRYFDYISAGTAARQARIKVKKIPVLFLCKSCGKTFSGNYREDKPLNCIYCDSHEYDLVSGRELLVETLEIK
ncbi:MAG: hydrogenase maturation nickel metallochaperone HypA [Anaerolineae bacterium]|nr:hydrogenase maturation nickel metallochaperone HypA [Anaerolineae bacterium]